MFMIGGRVSFALI